MEKELYKNAKKRVKLKKEFYHHLSAYITTNIVMFFVVLFNGGGLNWLMPAFFWGIGLSSHYIKVFGFPGIGVFDSREWERREIHKEIEKERRRYQEAIGEEFELRDLSTVYRKEDLV